MTSVVVTAQQSPQYTQYMYNTMAVNPGYAGSTGSLEVIALHRSQWVGISGAPQTQNLGIHSPLSNDKVGLGLNIINDRLGPSNEITVDGNFSYTLQTGYDTKLALGLKAGARMLNVDWSKGRFYDNNDVLLNTNINNKFMPSIGAGAYLYSDVWYAGLSIPNFIRSDYYNDVKESVVSDQLHFYVMGGYVFNLSESLKFKPALLAKIVNNAPLTVDVSANFMIQETVTLGASYRWDDSVSALVGFQISQSFFAGYSYDYSVTDFNKYNSGSHEIVLRFQMPQKSSRIRSPRFF